MDPCSPHSYSARSAGAANGNAEELNSSKLVLKTQDPSRSQSSERLGKSGSKQYIHKH